MSLKIFEKGVYDRTILLALEDGDDDGALYLSEVDEDGELISGRRILRITEESGITLCSSYSGQLPKKSGYVLCDKE